MAFHRNTTAIMAPLLVSAAWLLASDPCAAQSPIVHEDQSAIVAALKKCYADVTLGAAKNIVAVDFTDSEFSDADLSLLKSLPTLNNLTIAGSSFTDRQIPLVSELKAITQLSLENTEIRA